MRYTARWKYLQSPVLELGHRLRLRQVNIRRLVITAIIAFFGNDSLTHEAAVSWVHQLIDDCLVTIHETHRTDQGVLLLNQLRLHPIEDVFDQREQHELAERIKPVLWL